MYNDEFENLEPEISIQPSDWLANGCWPLKENEQVVVLVGKSFCIGTAEKCHKDNADVLLMKPVDVRGYPRLSHWVVDFSAATTYTPKESILQLRPVMELKGGRKTLKFFIANMDLIKQLESE